MGYIDLIIVLIPFLCPI